MRLEWVNRIKGLSIVLVIFYHSVITFYPFISDLSKVGEVIVLFWTKLNFLISPFRMPVFFFVSGYLVYKYVNFISIRESFDKRVLSIFYVLVIWLMIQTLSIGYFNRLLNHPVEHISTSNVVYASDYIGFLKSLLVANTSLWYLYALIVYFIVFRWLKSYKKTTIVIASFVSIFLDYIHTVSWGVDSILRNSIFFAIGCYYGPSLIDIIKSYNIKNNKLNILFLSLLSVMLLLLKFKFFPALFSIFIIVRVFMALDDVEGNIFLDYLSKVGGNTLAIYVSHRVILEFFSLATLFFIFNNYFNGNSLLILLIIYPIVATVLGVYFGNFLKKISVTAMGDILFKKPRFLSFSFKRNEADNLYK